MSYWLGIYFPTLPLAVFQHCSQSQAFAVLEKQKVLLCNATASDLGVELGLKQSSALAICPSILFAERDLDKETKLLKVIAETLYQFSSQVITHTNIRQQHSIIVEVAGSLSLFGGIEKLLLAIRQCLQQLSFHHGEQEPSTGLPHYVALAKTVKAAELLARAAAQGRPNTFGKPSAITDQFIHIDNAASESIHALLKPVSVRLLDCANQHISACDNLGITTIGQLYSLPMATLGRRFNKDFIHYLKQLDGKDADPRCFFQPPSFFYREFFYLDGIRNQQQLEQPISKLLQLLCDYLRIRQLSCQHLHWQFTRFSKQKNTIEVRLSKASERHDALLDLSLLHIQQLPLDSPVENIALKVDQFIPLDVQAQTLFTTSSHRQAISDDNFHQLVDTLRARLGERGLQQLVLCDAHCPELANQLTPVTIQQKKIRQTPSNKMKNAGNKNAIPQPIWLLNPPEQLVQKHGQLFRHNERLTIVRGPERIDSQWWSERIFRDYFIAVASHATNRDEAKKIRGFYWIYKEQNKQATQCNNTNDKGDKWYLHGIYS